MENSDYPQKQAPQGHQENVGQGIPVQQNDIQS